MTIKKKLLLISFTLVLSCVLVYFFSFFFQKNNSEKAKTNVTKNLKEMMSNEIENQVESLANNIKILSTDNEKSIEKVMQNGALVIQKLGMTKNLTGEELLALAKETGLKDIFLTDKDGIFVVSTNEAALGAELYKIYDGYRKIVSGEIFSVPYNLSITTTGENIYKYFAIPRLDSDGNINGIIQTSIDANYVGDLMQDVLNDNKMLKGLHILQKDSIVLTSNTKETAKINYSKATNSKDELVEKVASENKPELVYEGDDTILYYLPIQRFNNPAYVLLIEIDTNILSDVVNGTEQNFIYSFQNSQNNLIFIMFISLFFTILIIGVYIWFLQKTVLNPIKDLGDAAKKVSLGEIYITLPKETTDEIGDLTKSFSSVVESSYKQTQALERISKGDFTKSIELRSEKDIMSIAMNNMLTKQKNYIENISTVMASLSEGDLNSSITTEFEGAFLPIKESINDTITSQRFYIKEISRILGLLSEGNLNNKIELDFKGEYNSLKDYINKVVDTQNIYVNNISNIMKKISNGDLSAKVDIDYKGDFAPIKESINEAINLLNSYINEITFILNSISKNDLTKEISVDFKGDFSSLKISMEEIINYLNKTIKEINFMSDNVSDFSDIISIGSEDLLNGTVLQGDTISELSSVTEKINSQVLVNTEYSKEALDASKTSLDKVYESQEKMDKLLSAMGEISTSSKEITKIINTIKDIAFQTNLLALNAAVEAARAGVAGKGFSVVAEEVRNLATKSQESAVAIETLINRSVASAENGEDSAKETAASLSKIIETTETTSNLIETIAESISEELKSAKEINMGLDRISDVVKNNISTSQKSADSSKELQVRASSLKELVENFKLKA